MTKIKAIATELKSSKLADLLSAHSQIERSSQVGFNPEKLVPELTYVEAGVEKLTALCNAVGMKDKTAQAIEIFRAMTTSWGDKKVFKNNTSTNIDTSVWQSNVSDDFAPFEFSIAFENKRAELRILLEAQGTEPTVQSNWEAGLKLNQYLAENFNVSLDRFESIKDLFVPTNPEAKLAIWHSVCFHPDKEPSFKIYLSPQVQEQSRSAAIIEESLTRLGFFSVWPNIAEIAAQRGPDKDDFVYLSLDLTSHQSARVKVYLRHYDATVADLEKVLSLSQDYVPGDVTEFCNVMTEGQNSFSAKPVISCFSWVKGDKLIPSKGILHLPISNYAPNDLVVRNRLSSYFSQHDLSASTYHLILKSLATRSLDAGVGMHSYTSLRRDKQQPRVTIYLNPEVNAVRPPTTTATTQPTKALPSLEDMVWYYEDRTIANHPFLRRLQRESVNPQHIWLLFMNVREGVVTDFSRRLANVIGRIDDERIRCVLTKQLNDELGDGNIDRVHRKLFDRLMDAIEPWRMESFTEEMLTLGKEYSQRLEEIYVDPNPYLGVGAAILMEIHGKQFDLCLGNEFRKTDIDLSTVSWLTLHEELEIGHADESLILAGFVADSEEGVAGAIQGIEQARVASWKFLDGLYRFCFS